MHVLDAGGKHDVGVRGGQNCHTAGPLKRRFRRFLGSSVEFDLAPYMARHARIDRLATEVAATDDAGLTAWARRLKTRVR